MLSHRVAGMGSTPPGRSFHERHQNTPESPILSSPVIPIPHPQIFYSATYRNSAREMKLYLNGELMGTKILPFTALPFTGTGTAEIGGVELTTTHSAVGNWHGWIDDVRVYSTAHTQSTLQQIMRERCSMHPLPSFSGLGYCVN